MSWGAVLALMFGSKVGLLLTALPVAFVFFVINIVGSYLIFGGLPGLEQMVRNEQLSVAQFCARADPAVRADGRSPVPHWPGDEIDRRGRCCDPPRARPARRGDVGGRHDLLSDLRLDYRHDRHARLAAAAANAGPQL